MKKNNLLDERQEQKLLHIEHNGCWLAFWGLLTAILVQFVIGGAGQWRNIIGEWIVFMCLAFYMVADCLRNGIWDRKLVPSAKNNMLISMAAAFVWGAVTGTASHVKYRASAGAVATAVISAIVLFLICFLTLTLFAVDYKKRVKKMEESYNEEQDQNDR